jgi:hypothetical protein
MRFYPLDLGLGGERFVQLPQHLKFGERRDWNIGKFGLGHERGHNPLGNRKFLCG